MNPKTNLASARADAAGGDEVLDQYLAALRELPPLSPEEVSQLAATIRDGASAFRDAVHEIPGTSILVLARWQERRDEGRVTGLLSHHFRDKPDVDWSVVIDERLEALSRLVERRDATRGVRKKQSIEREMAETLASAEIQLEVLQEVALELRELLDARRTAAVAERIRQLGLGAETALAALRRAGEESARRDTARQKLAAHNLRLVVHVAKRYRNRGVAFLDLIQEGSTGLLRAVDKFDHELGYRFSTYAVWWIEQAVIRAIQRLSRTVRVPSHVYEAQVRYRASEGRLRARLAREPEREDLADELDVETDQVDLVSASLKPIHSLDTPAGDPDGTPLGERMPDESSSDPSAGLDRDPLRQVLAGGLRTLNPRERRVLEWRFGLTGEEPMTLQQIGDRLGLSRERSRQIQQGALARLGRQESVAKIARELLEG